MNKRTKVSKTLTTSYGISGILNEVKKAFPKIIGVILLSVIAGLLFLVFPVDIPATNAIEYLSAVSQISATVLGVFYAIFLVILELLKAEEIRKQIDRVDFVASFLLLSLTIVYSLVGILAIGGNDPVSFRNIFLAFIMVPPLIFLAGAILMIGVALWSFYIKRLEAP